MGLFRRMSHFGGSRSGETVTHDFARTRCWGHDYTFTPKDGGRTGSVIGWGGDGRRPRTGDRLLLQNKWNPTGDSLYEVTSHQHFHDPDDMWSADVRWINRATESA